MVVVVVVCDLEVKRSRPVQQEKFRPEVWKLRNPVARKRYEEVLDIEEGEGFLAGDPVSLNIFSTFDTPDWVPPTLLAISHCLTPSWDKATMPHFQRLNSAMF